jgi:hypothetical protein
VGLPCSELGRSWRTAVFDHSSPAVTTVYPRRLEGVEDRGWREVAAAIGA